MARYLDENGVASLWQKIKAALSKKLESIESSDDSIEVSNNRIISAKVSTHKNNNLTVVEGDGLFVPKNHKLTFGAKGEFVYDGTEDITVPIYEGEYEE